MMTPQEVSEHSFAKASFGGYNMAMVDEFLDLLTADYTALYKENTSLKAKMKVLADSLEEYRATEKGMRRALLAAQQAADEMVKEAESRKSELIRNAEADAQSRIEELRRQVADEEARLSAAQSATAGYVDKIRAACRSQEEFLDSLNLVTAQPAAPQPPVVDTVSQTVQDIEESVQKLMEQDAGQEEEPAEEPETAPPEPIRIYAEPRSRRDQERARAFDAPPSAGEDGEDASPTRRIDFDNLQFGANYDLK